MVMFLGHKKHTNRRRESQAQFQRRVKLLTLWTGLLATLVALVTALAELIHKLVKLLP